MSGFSNNSNVPLSVYLPATNQSPTVIDTWNRFNVNTDNLLASGAITWTFFTPIQNLTVSSITMTSGSAGATTPTLIRMGLYSYDETTAIRLAQTAVDNTLFAAAFTPYTRAFDNSVALSVALVAGKRYGIACISVATVPPRLAGASASAGINLLPKLAGNLTGQTDLVASATPVPTSNFSWGRVS